MRPPDACVDYSPAGVTDTESKGDRASLAGEFVLANPAPHVAVLELRGEHDLRSIEQTDLVATLQLLVDTNRLVVVDISLTTFMDSTVMAALTSAHRRAMQQGHRLRLYVGGASHWREKLRIAGLGGLFEIGLTREEALELDDA
jgi:anti-anti-sigma regulatory factor